MHTPTFAAAILVVLAGLAAVPAQAPKNLPSAAAMAAAREDVWGEAAIRHRHGPSYDFYKNLLPPLRYVNTAFRHYPITLSAPLAPVKARFVSNGSGINLRADKPPMWKEAGVPVAFLVGEKAEPFGADVERIHDTWYDAGYLPVVGVSYHSPPGVYSQHAFAPTRPDLARHGAVFVQLGVTVAAGRVAARFGADVTHAAGAVLDAKGRTVVMHGPEWKWDGGKKELFRPLIRATSDHLVVFTDPPERPPAELPDYDAERRRCVADWEKLLDGGSWLSVPEKRVQNAWRALVVGNHMIAVGDRMHYSAGNAYDHLYEAECGDAVRSLLLFGHADTARKMVGPLLDFNRSATRFHVAGHKLQMLAHHYWVTRDKQFLRESRAKWEPVVEFVRASRRTDNGLLPKDRYAGDINEQVYSLNSNAACWRGLRDMAVVAEELGEKDTAAAWHKEAAAFRTAILDAVTKSQDAAAKFVPVSLLAGEKPHDPLTATRTGSYYDLIIPYVLGSGVFDPGDAREGWIIDYLRSHGGLSMGMIRSTPHQGEFDTEPGVNVLYGLRYNLTLLRRGDRSHALAGFYGQLAQGMTRDTFIGGEGSRFLHGDRHGRSFYLPPNSASNATFLTTLRYLLVQDWDLDDDGKPETLRLCDALPPLWLDAKQRVTVDRFPTAFGEVSVSVESRVTRGEVRVTVTAPPRPVGRVQLRLPDPFDYTITAVKVGDDELTRDADGRVDLTGRSGTFTVRFVVK